MAPSPSREWKLAGLVGWLALLAACSTPQPPRTPGPPLRLGMAGALPSLDPHESSDFVSAEVLANAYEGLVTLDRSFRVRPALAVRWENPDAVTWRFHLRPGVRFHTGQPLGSADVVASLARARARQRLGLASYLAGVARVEARGDDSVDIVTDGPDPILLNRLASVPIVPADVPDTITASCGTGPYTVSRASDEVVLEAFPDYWGGAPAEQSVRLVPAGEPEQRRQHVRAGDLDILSHLTPEDVYSLGESAGLRVVTRPSTSVSYLQMRVDVPPFDDPRVREAVDRALDRPTLVQTMLLGYGSPAGQLVSPGVFGHDESVRVRPRDLQGARRLLAEAGHPAGLAVPLEFHEGRDVRELVAQLREAGLRIEPQARPWDALIERLASGSVPFYYGGFVSDSGDISVLLETLLHSPGPGGYGGLNQTGFADPELDALVEESRLADTTATRLAALQAAQRRALEARPLVPVLSPDDVYLVRDGVDWKPRLDGRVLAADVTRH